MKQKISFISPLTLEKFAYGFCCYFLKYLEEHSKEAIYPEFYQLYQGSEEDIENNSHISCGIKELFLHVSFLTQD